MSSGSRSRPPASSTPATAARSRGSPRNQGTRCDFFGTGATYPEVGQCVHSLAMAPGQPDRLYQQNHCGMYCTDDGGRSWVTIEDGLPSDFGFASPPTRTTRNPACSSPSSVPRTATSPTARSPSTAPATPARPGKTCARPAPSQRLSLRAAPSHGRRPPHPRRHLLRQHPAPSSPAQTKARPGPPSPNTCQRSGRWRRWWFSESKKRGGRASSRSTSTLDNSCNRPF